MFIHVQSCIYFLQSVDYGVNEMCVFIPIISLQSLFLSHQCTAIKQL